MYSFSHIMRSNPPLYVKGVVMIGGLGGYCFGLELANKVNTLLNNSFVNDEQNGISSHWVVPYFRGEWIYTCLSLVGSMVGVTTTIFITNYLK